MSEPGPSTSMKRRMVRGLKTKAKPKLYGPPRKRASTNKMNATAGKRTCTSTSPSVMQPPVASSDSSDSSSNEDNDEKGRRYEPLHSENCRGKKGDLRRMQCILSKDPDSLERSHFRDRGFSPNPCRLGQDLTPLLHAVVSDHPKCVDFLLEHGANPDAKAVRNSAIKTLNMKMFRVGETESLLYLMHYSEGIDQSSAIMECLLKHGVYAKTKEDFETARNLINEWMTLDDMLNDIELLLKYGSKNFSFASETYTLELIDEGNLAMVRLLLLYSCPFEVSVDCTSYRQNEITTGVPQKLAMIAANSSKANAAAKFIEAIKLYQAFGGNLWAKYTDKKKPENLIQFLKSHHKVAAAISSVRPELDKILGNPMSLKAMSRLAIRNCMGKKYMIDYPKLGLEKELLPLMRFEDIVLSVDPKPKFNFSNFML
ncbi:hypothetical protein B566_EDAN014022 [Ephemera danica]|nr:hypothetical protein B566_EDAN014022 [Ephemera danica]